MYFEWTKKPFVTPSDLQGVPSTPDVTVVGAGPAGIAAAIGLAARGMNVIVLEQRDTVSDGSRAIGFHRSTQQFFDQIGIGEEFRAMCHVRPMNRLFIGGEVFAETRYSLPPNEKHPDQAILQQCWVEELLLRRAADFPTIDIRWLSEVADVTQDNEHVTLTVQTPEGTYSLQSPYVVAADGARGTVRRKLGMKFETPISPLISDRQFVICDFEMETDLEPGRRLYLDLPYDPGASALFHFQPFGVWRLDYPLSDDQDPEVETQPDRVEHRVRQHLDMMGEKQDFKIIWTTAYRARARTLASYTNGRILFAGDAAHQTPIFGGRGLNSGFADVANLAWRIPRVVKGLDTMDSLIHYSNERKHVMMGTLKALTQVATFMTQPTSGSRFIRQAALELASTQPFVRELVDGHSARKVEAYPRGLNDAQMIGTPLVEARLISISASGEEETFLRDNLGPEFTLIRYEPEAGSPDEIVAVNSVDVLTIHKTFADGSLIDRDGYLREKLNLMAGTRLLIRPDGYVAAQWDGPVAAPDIEATINAETKLSNELESAAPEISPTTVTQRMFLALARMADEHSHENLALALSKALLVISAQAGDSSIVDYIEKLVPDNTVAHAVSPGNSPVADVNELAAPNGTVAHDLSSVGPAAL